MFMKICVSGTIFSPLPPYRGNLPQYVPTERLSLNRQPALLRIVKEQTLTVILVPKDFPKYPDFLLAIVQRLLLFEQSIPSRLVAEPGYQCHEICICFSYHGGIISQIESRTIFTCETARKPLLYQSARISRLTDESANNPMFNYLAFFDTLNNKYT